MPAQTLEAETEDVDVTVDAKEGILPEGTTIDVKAVDNDDISEAIMAVLREDNLTPTEIMAVDITLADKDGNAVQPTGDVTVKFSDAFDTEIPGTSAAVYHVDGDQVTKVTDVDCESEDVEFTTDRFSVYAAVKAAPMDVADEPMTMAEIESDVIEIEVYGTHELKGHDWKANLKNIVKLEEEGYNWGIVDTRKTVVTGRNPGEVTLTRKSGGNTETVVIRVKESPAKHTVKWYVNGRLVKTDNNVKDGDKPVYDRATPSLSDIDNEEFVGWSTSPVTGKVDYTLESNLPPVTADVNYYAVFMADAYFYFVLPGKSNTSTSSSDYMYSGKGKIIVPDGFSGRWYSSRYNLGDYILEEPVEQSIREGLKAYYNGQNGREEYTSNWKYSIDWTTFSTASSSVGYDYHVIPGLENATVFHVDFSVTIDYNNKATLLYTIYNPDGSTTAQSQIHTKGEQVEINSTVRTSGTFKTDGYPYESVKEYESVNYTFDGWYTDQTFTTKAPDSITVEQSENYYARYVGIPLELTYNANGGAFSDGNTENIVITAVGGSNVTLIPAPTKVGYNFAGWERDDDGNDLAANASAFKMPGHDLTLTAKWEKDLDQWKNIYYTAGTEDTVEGMPENVLEVMVGSEQSVNDAQPTRTGYLFTGWKSEQVEATSGTFTMPDSDVTFVAQWMQNTYNIFYEGIDSVTWPEGSDNPNPGSYIYGEKDIALIAPEKEDTVFIGWDITGGDEMQVNASDHANAVILSNSRGDIVCTARWATLTAQGWEGEYDGQSHAIQAMIDVEGYELWYNISDIEGWTTNVPSVTNVADGPLYVNVEARKEGYATLRKENILLKVNPKELDVDEPGVYTYNGLEQKWVPSVTDSENLFTEGIDYTVSYRDTDDFVNATNAGTVLTVTITGTGNYTGEFVKTYKIVPAPLVITTGSATRAYNGEALTNETITVSGFVNGEGDKVECYTTGSQTDVGTSKNTYIIGWNTDVKESNYTIKDPQLGDLVVSEKNIEPDLENPDQSSLTVEGIADKEYNGLEQKLSPVVKDGDTLLRENVDYKVSYPSDDYKNVGEEVEVVITGIGNYEGQISRTYNITPAPLKITTGHASKTYDGTPVTNTDITIEGLVNGETVDGRTIGTQTEVGTSLNKYVINWSSEKSTALQSNYEIKEENISLGTLEVIKASYTITVEGYTDPYDGNPHGITVNVPSDASVEYRLSDENGEIIDNRFTDATEGEITVYYTVTRPNYETYTGTSTVNIAPAPLTVTTEDATKVYDGKELKNEEGITITGFVNGEKEKVTYKATGTRTEEGTASNTYVINWNEVVKESNYIVTTEELGTLTVTAKSLVPDPSDPQNTMQIGVPASYIYDGNEHKWEPNVKDGNKSLVSGTDYDVSYSTDNFTDVTGEITVTIEGKGNYTGEVTRTYQIGKRILTIKTGDATKAYDGTALTSSEIKVTGLVPRDQGKDFDCEAAGSRIEVGHANNIYNITWGSVNPDNYMIKEDLGDLEVTARSLNPNPENPEDALSISDPEEYTYNGNPHQWIPEVRDGDTPLINGRDYDVTYSTDNFTDAIESIEVTIEGKGNYDGIVTKTYKIKPASLTLVSADLSQVYNGKWLSNGTTALKIEDGWVNGESAPYNFTGYQFYVGSSENTFEILWDDVKATAKKGNYTVQITPGTLEVTTSKDDQEIDPNLVVTKKHIRTRWYKVGDVITFTIRVTNIFNETKTVKVTEQPGVTIIGEDSAVLASGATAEFKAQYTVKDEDIVNGTFTNTVTADFGDVTISNEDEVTEFVKPMPKLSITKEAIEDTEHKAPYGYEETVAYGIRVFNEGTLTLTNIQVKDELTGDNWTIDSLAPGEKSDLLETSYIVNDTDILEGKVENTATAIGSYEGSDDPVEATATETVQTVDPYSHLTLIKETTSKPANENAYALGEKITYKITAVNDGNQRLTDVTITDALTGDSWGAIPKLAQGETTVVGTTSYTVSEDDVRAGKVINVVTATATTPDPAGVKVEDGVKEDAVVKAEPSLSVIKTITSENEGGYGLGDEISYEITVTNNGNLTVDDITVTDALTGEEWTIDSLTPDADPVKYATTHKVTEDDILEGEVVNTAVASGTASDGTKVEDSGEVTANMEAKDSNLTLSKRTISEPANGESYVLGETIVYGITAINNGNLTLTDITITDELTGGEWKIDSLAPNASSEEYRTTYVVTEADILAGRILNEVTAAVTSPDPDNTKPDVTPDDVEDRTESPNGHLTLTKTTTSTPANGAAYVLGETINYQIVATNDGNLTLKDVVVTDELTGGKWEIETIAPGQNSTVMETSYVVTEADVLNGTVVNEATATGVSPDPNKPEPGVTPDDVTDTTETKNGHMYLTKETTSTPANGSTYALGETVTYEIRAINDGNLTLTNVEVEDALTGDKWVIAEIKPGQRSTAMTTSYVITEADILAGGVANVATAKGDSPDPEKPEVPVDPGEKEVPTATTGASLFVEKTASASVDGGTYGLGETVTYTITVTNNGNVTVNNIDVDDPLTGESWIIRSLAPNASQSFTTTYTLTEADIQRGQIVNTATAAGTDPSGNPVTGDGSRTITTDAVNTNLTVDKTVIDPKAQYNIGDKIQYRIEVANRGNVTLHNVRVTDTMSGTGRNVVFTDLGGGTLNNGVVVFAEIPVGETRTILCEYTVVRADAGATPITNRATASSDEGKGDTPSDVTPVTPTEKEYTLTIHYTNTRGATMAPDYVGKYVEGEQFHIASPRIRGYKANYSAINSSINGMPANDLTYTVIYRRNNNNSGGSSSGGSTSDPTPTPTPGPAPGDNPTPAPGTNPPAGGTAPAGTAVPQAEETAEDTEAPVGVIVPNEEGGYDVVPVEDTDVPLAQAPLGEGTIADIIHECCALHFLIMLICMLILAFYTWDSKKLQASIFDLRDQLGGGRQNRRQEVSRDVIQLVYIRT